jgi:hypothetical protein
MGKARSWCVEKCTRCKQPLDRENAEYIDGKPFGRLCARLVRRERGLTFESGVKTGGRRNGRSDHRDHQS